MKSGVVNYNRIYTHAGVSLACAGLASSRRPPAGGRVLLSVGRGCGGVRWQQQQQQQQQRGGW